MTVTTATMARSRDLCIDLMSDASAWCRTTRRWRCSARSSKSGARTAFPTRCCCSSIRHVITLGVKAGGSARAHRRGRRTCWPRAASTCSKPAAAATSPITAPAARRLSDPRPQARSMRRPSLRARPRGGHDPACAPIYGVDGRARAGLQRRRGSATGRSARSASASRAGSPVTAWRSTCRPTCATST